MASARLLEISDLPPPETVQGLWQSVASAWVPTSVRGDVAGRSKKGAAAGVSGLQRLH